MDKLTCDIEKKKQKKKELLWELIFRMNFIGQGVKTSFASFGCVV